MTKDIIAVDYNNKSLMLTQVSIVKARHEFKLGHNVYCKPSKASFSANYINLLQTNVNFDTQVNSCSYYNCNTELGLYLHYFIEIGE